MDILNNTSNIHWVNNILPNISNRLFGFVQDPIEIIKFEGYSIDGFPIIASFYGNNDTPKFVALIKLTLNSIPIEGLNAYVTKNDIQSTENIKGKYSSIPIPKQVVIYKVDKDFQIVDQTHINI